MTKMKMTPDDKVKFVNHEIDEYQKLSSTASGQGNDTLRLLSGQLILIAGTIITISAAFIAPGQNDGQGLDIQDRYLLTGAWIAMALSMLFGIIDIIVTAKFFIKWQVYHYKMAEELSKADYQKQSVKKVLENIRNKLKDMKPKSETPHWLLYLQVGLLGLGVLVFLALIIRLLFAPSC